MYNSICLGAANVCDIHRVTLLIIVSHDPRQAVVMSTTDLYPDFFTAIYPSSYINTNVRRPIIVYTTRAALGYSTLPVIV